VARRSSERHARTLGWRAYADVRGSVAGGAGSPRCGATRRVDDDVLFLRFIDDLSKIAVDATI
jgi:hypothetical protein